MTKRKKNPVDHEGQNDTPGTSTPRHLESLLLKWMCNIVKDDGKESRDDYIAELRRGLDAQFFVGKALLEAEDAPEMIQEVMLRANVPALLAAYGLATLREKLAILDAAENN